MILQVDRKIGPKRLLSFFPDATIQLAMEEACRLHPEMEIELAETSHIKGLVHVTLIKKEVR